MAEFWAILNRRISIATGRAFSFQQRQPLGGGCINAAWRLSDGAQDYFVKLNTRGEPSMFEAEAAGLEELAATAALRVPEPICCGLIGRQAYLVLEYIPLAKIDTKAMEELGRRLALLHGRRQPYFGWHRNNTIGATSQPNDHCENWVDFWREQRLGHQLRLVASNGHGGTLQRQGERLLARLETLFAGYRPAPALLHGDLWSGNVGRAESGEPVLFDPAVYYGDREADLAMTELFGGFSESFYRAYSEVLPLRDGYPLRRTLYNLYHVLNHLNLFGGAYRSQAETMILRLLSEF
ncbi:MAG: fructosamine kinase family protein [Candidatus Competibacter sp.]